MKIAPSILDADFGHLQSEITSIKDADRIHLDVMDRHFVPNMSFGAHILKSINWHNLPLEVHLMVNEPEQFFADFLALEGMMGITFHIENTGRDKAKDLLRQLKDAKVNAGICLDGYTDLGFLDDEILDLADQILFMSIKAGFGGQKFQPGVLDKIRQLRDRGFTGEIEVDGGVNDQTWPQLAAAGCDIAVVGSYLMKKPATERANLIAELTASA